MEGRGLPRFELHPEGLLEKLGQNDEIKFVLKDRADYEWAMRVVHERRLAGRNILFAPVWDELKLTQLAEWMLEDSAPARLQPQLHKYIWSPHAAGV